MAVTSAEGVEAAPEPARPGRAVIVALVVAVAVPLVVLLVRVLLSHWLAFADWASIELRTRAVGTSHTPLVGPFSRYGWNHPGPLMFYALALPFRALGGNDKGLLFGAWTINVGALACIGVVLWRRGRALGLVVGTAVVLLLVRSLHAGFLVNPWNPYVIVLPMLAVVLLCWAATDGDSRWALPLAVAIGSFAIQTHVGAVTGVVVPIAITVVFCMVDARRQRRWAACNRTLLIALAVGVICWIPPIVQQFQSGGGNFSELWRFWTKSQPVTGWSTGARILGAQLALPAPWITGHDERLFFTGGLDPSWHVPYALILSGAALVLAVRRGDRQAARLCTLGFGLAVAGWIAAARIVDTPFFYVVQWLWIVGPVMWLGILWTGLRALPAVGPARRSAMLIAGAGIAALVVALSIGSVHAGFPNAGHDEESIVAIAPAARTALRGLPQPVLVENSNDVRSATTAAGILLLGIRAGVDTRVPRNQAFIVGAEHTLAVEKAASRVVVAVEEAGDKYRVDPGFRLIASYESMTPAERAERAALNHDVYNATVFGEGASRFFATHPGVKERVSALNNRAPRIEIYLRVV